MDANGIENQAALDKSGQLEIRPIRGDQRSEVAGLLARAFLHDPAFLGVMPDISDSERLKRSTILFAADLAACLKQGCPIYAQDRNRVAAALLAYPPGGYPLSSLVQIRMLLSIIATGKPFLPGRWKPFQLLLSLLNETSKIHPKQPHYYLEWLGVDPQYQGQGLGSALLKTVLQKADQETIPTYLETAQPRNLPLYQRLGFRTFCEKTILGIPVYFMWRDPQ